MSGLLALIQAISFRCIKKVVEFSIVYRIAREIVEERILRLADVCEVALFAAGALKDADTLPMTEQGLVEIVDAARVLRQESLQEVVRGIVGNLLAN
jgi:hypothetical protein